MKGSYIWVRPLHRGRHVGHGDAPPVTPEGPEADLGPLRRADGVTLLGPYQGSGLRDTPYLLGLPDGRVVHVSRLLYLVVESLDRGSAADVAARVTARFGRVVSEANVRFLLGQKLAPLGVLAGTVAPPPARPAAAPVLGLGFRGVVLPARAVRAAAVALRPLFWPPLVAAVLLGAGALDVWLARHGVRAGLALAVSNPAVTLAVATLVAASAGFHELGHATACRYGGGRPGRIGVGIFVVWPAFFSDISDSYRLSRAGRLRTDLGGVYFNVVFMLAAAGAYVATGFEALVVVILLEHVLIACQLLPILRLDGYYVLSDLAGVPDLARYVRHSRRRPAGPERYGRSGVSGGAELLPHARRIVQAWAALSVALLAAVVVVVGLHASALAAMETSVVTRRVAALGDAAHRADVGRGLVASVAVAATVVPFLGVGAMLVRFGRGAARRRARAARPPGPDRPEPQSHVVGARGCRHRRPPPTLATIAGVCVLLGVWARRRSHHD